MSAIGLFRERRLSQDVRDRRALANVAVAALLLTAGCVGFLTGEEALSFDASRVVVADDAHSEAGYEEVRVESTETNQSVTVAGQTRTVSMTNRVAGYQRAVELGPAGNRSFAQFTVFTTPLIEVAGQTLNPLTGVSDREVVAQLRTGYDSLEDVRPAGNRTVEVLGEGRTVSRFHATSTVAGKEVDLTLHVTKFRHGEDVVVAVAIHPARLDGERARVETMLGGIEHEAGD